MSGLFSTPKIPKPQEPARLPDQQSQELRESRRRRVKTESSRSGRQSTVLQTPTGSAGKIGA